MARTSKTTVTKTIAKTAAAPKTPARKRPVAPKPAAKATSRTAAKAKPKAAAKSASTKTSSGPEAYRVRVRMYRHGLGDCFLLTFPRKAKPAFQILIDCGALARDKDKMARVVEHIRDTVRGGTSGKARLDVVVGTHEHKDHVSGFNQARTLFNEEIDIGSVWLAWTENLNVDEANRIRTARKRALEKLTGLVGLARQPAAAARFAGAKETLAGVEQLLQFSQDDDSTGAGRVADAMAYLKLRGKDAGDLRYLEPGGAPFGLGDVDGVRVYVLGPPKDPSMLKTSAVTETMKQEGVIYHLAAAGLSGMDALSAAIGSDPEVPAERYHPFGSGHRITKEVVDPETQQRRPHPSMAYLQGFLDQTYDDPKQAWRRIDDDWLGAFGQLALDLDNDTNNTSLVLAFEFEKGREVLLFVADAQIGSWLSWRTLNFEVPGRSAPLPAADLLGRTVFYKVGHHSSHNATAKVGGLESMTSDGLVAFVPLDKATAASQGKKGWEMPAPALFKALQKRTGGRLVLSDTTETPPAAATQAGVVATSVYVDYFLV